MINNYLKQIYPNNLANYVEIDEFFCQILSVIIADPSVSVFGESLVVQGWTGDIFGGSNKKTLVSWYRDANNVENTNCGREHDCTVNNAKNVYIINVTVPADVDENWTKLVEYLDNLEICLTKNGNCQNIVSVISSKWGNANSDPLVGKKYLTSLGNNTNKILERYEIVEETLNGKNYYTGQLIVLFDCSWSVRELWADTDDARSFFLF